MVGIFFGFLKYHLKDNGYLLEETNFLSIYWGHILTGTVATYDHNNFPTQVNLILNIHICFVGVRLGWSRFRLDLDDVT